MKKSTSKKDSSEQTLLKGKFGLQSSAAPTKPENPSPKTKEKNKA